MTNKEDLKKIAEYLTDEREVKRWVDMMSSLPREEAERICKTIDKAYKDLMEQLGIDTGDNNE